MALAMRFLGKKVLKSFGALGSGPAQPNEHGWKAR